MTSRVFILEPTSLNVSAAEKYGEVVYVFPRGARRSGIWDPKFPFEIIQALTMSNYDPERDYFCVVGHMAQIAMAIGWMVCQYSRIKTLMFSSTENDYKEKYIGERHGDEPTGSRDLQAGTRDTLDDSRGAD